MLNARVIILSPVYNEAAALDQTIRAVVAQSLRPVAWIFVNDHSTDNTVDIILKWKTKYHWIEVIDAKTKVIGNYGPKIVSVRWDGYEYIQNSSIKYDFLAHLDADIILPVDYFEKIILAFSQNASLGICGGILRNAITNDLEKTREWWIRDGCRVYRKSCLDTVGYQKKIWPHDSSDLMYALYKGWETTNIDSIALHLRPTGNKMRLKYCFYIGSDIRRFGYNFFSGAIKSYKYLKKKPYILGCICFLSGYLFAVVIRKPFYFEKEFRVFLNKFYLRLLTR